MMRQYNDSRIVLADFKLADVQIVLLIHFFILVVLSTRYGLEQLRLVT